MSGNLNRRLTALEQIAADAFRRETRTWVVSMPESRCLKPSEIEEAVDEAIRIREQHAEWKRAGLSEREIMQRVATELGSSVEQVERECQEYLDLAERGP